MYQNIKTYKMTLIIDLFKNMCCRTFILTFFLIIIPILEIYISETNKQEEIICSEYMKLTLIDWSIVKNSFTIFLTFTIFFYIGLNSFHSLRITFRKLIYMENFVMILWLIVGLDLMFRTCILSLSDGILIFNILNEFLGLMTIFISYYVVKLSMRYNDQTSLLDSHPYMNGMSIS